MFCNCNPARANSVFWARALNIPLPHSYVFPQATNESISSIEKSSEVSATDSPSDDLVGGMDEKGESL